MSSQIYRQPYTFDRVVRMVLTALGVAAVVWLVYVLRNVLLPFGVAVLVAYILEPFVQYNKQLLHLKKRSGAVLITLFEVAFLIGILGYFFVPSIIDELKQVGVMVTTYVNSDRQIEFIPPALHEFLKETIDFDHIAALLSGVDWISIGSGVMNVLQGGIDILLSVFNWLLTFLYVAFIMLDYEKLRVTMHAMVPPQYRKRVFTVGRDIKESMNHYFRGQALVAFCVGVLFALGFLIVGLPLAIVLGLFIGVLNLVPYLQLVSFPFTALLCLIYSTDGGGSFWTIFGEALLVYIIVQGIQDLILTPKIMGKVMGLNPAIILLSLSIWGTLLGFLGMIIALPLTTLLISYYERYILQRRARRKAEEVTGID